MATKRGKKVEQAATLESGLVTSFAEALGAATANPADESPWERLEDAVATDDNLAGQLLALYRTHLAGDFPRPISSVLCRRAVRYAADCFGDNAPEAVAVLRAVLAAAPEEDWAFRHLVATLTMAERWSEVLDAYDGRLAAGRSADRHAAVLEEAARIAKDFAGDEARAVNYLGQLLRLRPSDVQVASSLERLLERRERWDELIGVWQGRLATSSPAEERALRLRSAVALHDKLARPEAALEQVRALLPGAEEDDPLLVGLLEKLLADERATPATRLDALAALRQRCEACGARARVPALLRIAIGFSSAGGLRALRRECGERLHALGDTAGALEQYVALLALAPEDTEIEDRLRQLAEAGGDLASLARGLAAAAHACEAHDRRALLFVRAARVEDRRQGNQAAAAALFETAAAEVGAPDELRLEAWRRLEELYDEQGEPAKRLRALQRLAAIEPKAEGKRLVWAQAAELAASAGDLDGALGAWEARLALDPGDVEALAAQGALLARGERWRALGDLLRRRIATTPPAHQVRADLIEIATLARDRLDDPGRAVDTWREVTARFGEDDQSVSALADLYTATGRLGELAELLSRNAVADRHRHADLLARLGDALRAGLGEPRGAIDWYRRALEAEPAHEGARAGLSALLGARRAKAGPALEPIVGSAEPSEGSGLADDAELATLAAEPLAVAAGRTDSWQLLLELVPHRLAGTTDVRGKVRLLEEAAATAEGRGDDRLRALEWLCQALPLAAADLRLERQILRLAEATGDHARAARALAEAIATGDAPPALLAHLHERRARLLEERLGELEPALDSYAAALALAPQRLELRQGLVRTAARLGRWTEAAAAVVDPAAAPGAREATLLPLFESLAIESDGVRAAADALAHATDQAPALDAATRRALHARVAGYFVEQCPDPDAADAALGRALAAEPLHHPTLLRRAEGQRGHPDRRLLDTLTALAAGAPGNLDHLREAAVLALDVLANEALGMDVLGHLWEEARRLLRSSAPAVGQHQAADAGAYALDEMVQRHAASGAQDRVRRATALLLDGARLPFDEDRRRRWLGRAAELTETDLADRPRAIDIWRLLHEQAPHHEGAREALARLYEHEERFADLVALRVAELDVTPEAERRLTLRLEIVRAGGLLEQRSNPPQVLRANLAERPGHRPTVRKLSEVLLQKGRPGELADVLEEQARMLQDGSEPAAAAELWAALARLAEGTLADVGRAIAAWQRAAQVEPTWEALDALGRLELGTGQPAAAAEWLDRRLAMTEGEARTEVAAQLSRAYLAAGQRHRAIACLDRALVEFPHAETVRARLAELYRDALAWEPLARVLAEGCDHTSEVATIIAGTREAAEIYARLGLLSRAVPVLEKAVRLLPDDESLRSALADGLHQSGRSDEARTLLLGLIEQAGWRRSRKRATLHHRVAQVAKAQGDLPLALEQLEQATSMDVSNLEILQQLAEVAESAGAFERAERAYRALLVQRREDGRARPDSQPSGLAVTEVLLRLHDLAGRRGRNDEATELLESAVAAAINDPEEARCLQRGLLHRGAHDELARFFERRLAHTPATPAQADVYADMAESLRAQNRLTDAFEAQLLAVDAAPDRISLHQPLVDLARAAGRVEQLVDRLLALRDRRRRKADADLTSVLLLRAAELAEQDLGDLDRAAELYRRAEETPTASLAAWFGLARIAEKRGEHGECIRLAGLLKQGAANDNTPAGAEALFRAAALELPGADTREAGIASLCQALERSRDVERALVIVTTADLPQAELVRILPLYERVARQSGDERTLLDYLERRAATAEATIGEVREAIDLAVALDRPDRIEPLLLRLADIAAERPDGRGHATWALLELIQRKKAAGDLEGAARALERSAELLDLERVLELASELSERAARAGNLRLGAELLERLRARAPQDETVWRPLLDHYVKLGDREGLERLVAETLPLLAEVRQRNELRVRRARFLLARDDRDQAAAEGLRDVLLEEPRQAEALSLLAGYCERTGAEGDLTHLLEQVFEAAAESGVEDAAVEAALRLGAVLERTSTEQAVALYERALLLAPGHRPLLERLLARRPPGDITRGDAELMEQLLATERGAGASKLARELAAAWTALGDRQATRRVLEKGCALAPADSGLIGELEHRYRADEAWGPLADLLAVESDSQPDTTEAAALLVEAAELRRSRLGDFPGALALLGRAHRLAPLDADILTELARALVAANDPGGAIVAVRSTLASPEVAGARPLPLLLLLAEVEGAAGDHRAAVATLEEASASAPDAAGVPLERAVATWRREAATAADAGALREATLKLAVLVRDRGAVADAQRLVEEVVESGGADAGTARLLCDLAESAGDFESALAAALELLYLEGGQAQVAAAERLAALAEQMGRPDVASSAIEAALAAAPAQLDLLDQLAQLYERTGERRKLALLLFDQASRSQDVAARFELLRRAGFLSVQAGGGAVAMMALNEALTIRPADQETIVLLSDAHTLAGELGEAADLLRPLVASHKGKASPALAALHMRLAGIAARAGDQKSELDALNRALDADKKNGALVAEIADRAQEAGDQDLEMKALRAITVHEAGGPISAAVALLRQARIAHFRGEKDRAILYARRAVQEATEGDPIHVESREFLKQVTAAT
jgi:tetratricopeptide (TPR) repeat protein